MPKVESRMPVLTRALGVRSDSLSEQGRTIELVFATEDPAPMWHPELGDYDEILDCTEQSADLSRVRNGGALLSEHERDRQIGVIEEARFENRVGIARVRFDTHPLAEQEWQSVKNRIRRNFSVGYRVKELTAEKVSDEDGNVYRATSYEPLEISLVSVPADTKCQAIRSAQQHDEETQPIDIRIPSTLKISDTMIRSLPKFFHIADTGGNTTGGTAQPNPPSIDPAEMQRQIEAETNKRMKLAEDNRRALRQAAKDFAECDMPVPPEMLEDALDKGSSVDQLRAAVWDDLKAKKRNARPTPSGSNASGIQVVGERQAQFRTPGEAFVNSEQFKNFAKSRGSQRSARVEDVVKHIEGSIRATNTTAIAGFTNPDYQTGIKLVGVQRLTIRDLIAQGVTGSNAIIYRREVSHTNAATMVAEGAAKPEASFDTEEVTAPVRKIAVWTKETEELVMDFPAFQSYINARLPFMVEQTEEAQILNGDGTGQNLTGLLNTSGILTQAKSTDTVPDALYKALTKIRTTVGGFAEPDGFVVNPLDWQDVRLSKDANNQYYAGGPFTGAYGNGGIAMDYIWGKPVVITTAIAEGTALAGAFKLGAQVFDRQGLTIETTNTDQDDFIKNLMTIRAEKRLALAVYFPKFFCTVTGI